MAIRQGRPTFAGYPVFPVNANVPPEMIQAGDDLMIRCAAFALILGSFALATPSHAADPTGTWLTQEQDAHIRMAKCGTGYCGTIIWLRDSKDPVTGKPVVDDKNPDPAKRHKSLLGSMIAINFVPATDAPNKWTGHFYNADDGNTYAGSITPAGATELSVQGCLGAICQTQTWTRVKR
jgi:uncharacterized protein (DUF2147 family)